MAPNTKVPKPHPGNAGVTVLPLLLPSASPLGAPFFLCFTAMAANSKVKLAKLARNK